MEEEAVHCKHARYTAVVDDGDVTLSRESVILGVSLSLSMPMFAPLSRRRRSSTPKRSGPHRKDRSSVRRNCYRQPRKRLELQECEFQKLVIKTACLSSKGDLHRRCRICKVRTK